MARRFLHLEGKATVKLEALDGCSTLMCYRCPDRALGPFIAYCLSPISHFPKIAYAFRKTPAQTSFALPMGAPVPHSRSSLRCDQHASASQRPEFLRGRRNDFERLLDLSRSIESAEREAQTAACPIS
jgi:hypothetical protein